MAGSQRCEANVAESKVHQINSIATIVYTPSLPAYSLCAKDTHERAPSRSELIVNNDDSRREFGDELLPQTL